MRLTLRTLLAYMDDILDPADQENLSRQVQESETASELIHRTRDATRRMRLGAPPVIGEGMELDPNVAAEYLDSTLSADDMSEYQQVCLDSDVHLAEVASCHHILTMVLGEPAEIEPEMRQRMYGVPGRVDEWRKLRLDGPHQPKAVAEVPATPVAKLSDSGQDEPITEVPDYLRDSDASNFGRMAIAFAAALVLGFTAFILFGPDGMLRGQQQLAQDEDTQAAADNAADNQSLQKDDEFVEAGPMETGVEVGGGPDGGEAALGQPGLSPEDGTAPAAIATNDTASEADIASAPSADVKPPMNVQPPTDPQPSTVAQSDTGDVAESSDADNAATQPDATATSDSVTTPSDMTQQPSVLPDAALPVAPDAEDPERVASNTDAIMPDTTTKDVTTAAAPAAPLDAAPLGTMVSLGDVLLRWNEETGEWLRLPARSSIVAGDQLLSLPTYRPALALVSGLRVEFADAAKMSLDFMTNSAGPRLEIDYGRFLLINTNMEPVEIEIVVSGESKRVVLDSTAILGLNVDRPFVPGADVEESLGRFTASFYAPKGLVAWDVGAVATEAEQGSQWTWRDATMNSITDDVEWMDGQSLPYLQQNVSKYFEKELELGQPARMQLLELFEGSRRREDKALATLSGAHVGQFVPFVQALADTQQQSSWADHIKGLRAAMSRSTQAANDVHQTLTEQRGAALADDLFRMLRGYTAAEIGTTPDEVRAGVTRQLIDWLEHDRLEYRVLAIHNLKQIYGGKTLGYNPVITEPARQERAVKLWRTRLADNELVPANS